MENRNVASLFELEASLDSLHSVAVLSYSKVWFGLFASSCCLSSGDSQGKDHFPLASVITMVMMFNSYTANQWYKSNKIALNCVDGAVLEGQFGGQSFSALHCWLWPKRGIISSGNGEVRMCCHIKGKDTFSVSTVQSEETMVQIWTVRWSRCLPELTHTHLTPEMSMGIFLPASVGLMDHSRSAWHISHC